MKEEYCIYGDGKINYFIQRFDGPTVVLLHGFCLNSTVWTSTFNYFRGKYQLLAIDLLSFGKSNLETSKMNDVVEQVHFLIEKLQINSFSILGHSMGGYIALAYAEKYSSKLTSIGLIHSHPFQDSIQKVEQRQKQITFLKRLPYQKFVKQLIPNLFIPSYRKLNTSIINNLIDECTSLSNNTIINALNLMLNRKSQDIFLLNTKIPILIVQGRQEHLISLEILKEIDRILPKETIHYIKDAGHMSFYESSDEFLTILEQFLNGNKKK